MTSPGRSSSQTAPNASSPITTRKMTTRITCRSSLAQPCEGVGGELPARLDGSRAYLRLLHPGGRRRAHGGRQSREFRERARDVAFAGLDLDALNDRCGVAPWCLLRPVNAHELGGMSFQPLEKAALGRQLLGDRNERGYQCRELTSKRGRRRHAGRRKRRKRRQQLGIGREGRNRSELRGEWLPALYRGRQRRGRNREPPGSIVALRARALC